MVRGQADFGLYAPKVAGGTMADVGEAAARLGSIVTWDRRGNVELLDDFESPVKRWNWATAGTASSIILSSATMRSGSQSLKFTVGVLANNVGYIIKNIPLLNPQKIGIEFSFCVLDEDTRIEYMTYCYDGVTAKRIGLKITFHDDKLYYYDGAPDWVEFATWKDFFEQKYCFHTVKIVGDLVNDRHVRLLVDNTEYDMSAIPLRTYASPQAPRIQLDLRVYARVNGTFVIHLDDFIVTSNEP